MGRNQVGRTNLWMAGIKFPEPVFGRVVQHPGYKTIWFLTLLLFFCSLTYTYAQLLTTASDTKRITGAPFIRNYPPDEYGAHNQNWAIVQDKRGVMYFGNSQFQRGHL